MRGAGKDKKSLVEVDEDLEEGADEEFNNEVDCNPCY